MMSLISGRFKAVIILAVSLACGLMVLGLVRRAFLWGAVTEGKLFLAQNFQEYLDGATNFTSQEDGQIFPYTNQIEIRGTNYTCAIGLNRSKFKEKGILAITTNRLFIWIDKNGDAHLR